MKLREVEVSTPKMGKMTLSLMRLTVEQGEVLFDLPFEHDVHRRHRYVIKEFPVLRWSNGMPWHEANAWFVSQAPNIPLGELSISTLHSNGYALLAFMRFLEASNLAWNYLPIIDAERAINKYRGHLISERTEGHITPSTTSSRMGVALRFYRWAQRAGLLHQDCFEIITPGVINIRNRLGPLARIPQNFSNLSIPNKSRGGDVVEGGLVPLEVSERDDLLNFANHHASIELLLMLKVAFATGLRVGSICDLKLNTLEWAYADADERLFWMHVGPGVKGAPVKTKFSVNGRVLISKDLLDELKTYVKSVRRLMREAKALDSDNQLVFLNKNGKSYGREGGMQSSQVCGLLSKLKVKAVAAGLDISDFHIHRARASFGTYVVMAGMSLMPEVQLISTICFTRDLMLHKHESVTMTYVRFIENRAIKSAFADEYTRMLIGRFAESMSNG
ncbi:tyrosine-type recombinase/integrase [Pseudomonas sp. MYb541]|uniref:tyrosine-type recombinase/integrase n=1 Tax=Pseudomonas sp. MYb541 TaxID=2745402 RepID=UPI0030991252